MSKNREHIDIELLRKYYGNELNSTERHRIEKEALSDPFLADAMEGFENNPGSFESFYIKNKRRLKPKYSSTFLWGTVILAALFVTTKLISYEKGEREPHSEIQSSQPIHKKEQPSLKQNEVEVLPHEIEILTEIETIDQISPQELMNENKENETFLNEEITVENEPLIKPEFDSQEEEVGWNMNGMTIPNSVYLFDLEVLDYRKVDRTNKSITYKRFELTGVSADRENEHSTSNLIEKEVQIPYTEYLEKSMYFFSKQQYKQALNRFITILKQYPNDMNALFYGGLSYFNLGVYDKAINQFEAIEKSRYFLFKEEAMWYSAKAYIQLNEVGIADSLLNQIIIRGGFYLDKAINLKSDL
ncbi:tetratricopeptide repeat protein [Crocinitomix algicola]|uniref:tetratricopeptide repeat protein n=1 Tax=Crocinitomix algicola TaxID=1740263 RepID=UPI00082964BF|nr:tetratricopeptide repeat protein [Crocinitomix algicola]